MLARISDANLYIVCVDWLFANFHSLIHLHKSFLFFFLALPCLSVHSYYGSWRIGLCLLNEPVTRCLEWDLVLIGLFTFQAGSEEYVKQTTTHKDSRHPGHHQYRPVQLDNIPLPTTGGHVTGKYPHMVLFAEDLKCIIIRWWFLSVVTRLFYFYLFRISLEYWLPYLSNLRFTSVEMHIILC